MKHHYKKCFSDCCEISKIDLARDKNGQSRGWAYITFTEIAGAEKAKQKNESKIDDRFIVVEDVRPREPLRPSNFALSPLADILSSKNLYQIEVELPGVKKEDIKVECDQNVLSITATKKEVISEDKKKIHQERTFGKISRSFQLPNNVETDKIEAALSEGVLTITLPMKESSKIEVKIK